MSTSPFSQLQPPQFTPLCYNIIEKIEASICYFGDIVEYIGRYFGNWLVIEDRGRDAKSNKIVLAECKCGKKSIHRLKTLTSGDTTQCKSCSSKSRNGISDLTGKIFGKWTVLSISEKKHKNTSYLCKCICGIEKEITGYNLRKGFSLSCVHCKHKTHGLSYTSTHHVWRDMKNRCTRPALKSYKYYGGRGISVCERWFSFDNFLQDMGLKPDGLQIDRINNDGNYEPENCRWVTPKVNRNNQRPPKKRINNVNKSI